MAWKPTLARRRFWLVCVVLALAGCQEQEQIRSYDVPKEPLAVGAAGGKQRLLAVMVPREKQVWFFKLMGPEKAVAEQIETFDRFVAGVHFLGEGSARYDFTPESWQRLPEKVLPGNGQEVQHLRRNVEGSSVDLTVTLLPAGGRTDDPRSNINRWRGQLGLGPIDDKELEKLVGNVKVDGIEGTRVDFVGGAKKRARVAAAQGRPFRFTKPDGWEEKPPDAPQGVPRLAVFLVRDGQHSSEVSVVPLVGQGGGALANVNRWRQQQLGLEAIDDAQLQKDLHTLDAGGVKAHYVDLVGRNAAGPQRLLAAWMVHGGQTWFIKMMGSPELVGKQRAAFEAFVQSMRFADGQGAAHE